MGSLDIKTLLILVGASFFANLVALIAVVTFITTPLTSALAKNTSDIDILAEALVNHRELVGHPGAMALTRRVEEDVKWIRSYLEKDRKGP